MKVLITGVTGFVGSHLAETCLQKGCEVYGTTRWRSNTENIDHLIKEKQITLKECDLVDAHAVRSLIEEIKPDRIFHLAAQSYVKASWTEPMQTLDNNIRGQVNIFEAVRKIEGYDPLIMIAGSSEEYGNVEASQMPINEDVPLLPVSPYGVSKVAQDLLGFQYYKSYGLKIIRTRAFNHTGPRRGEVFVCSSFAKQIVQIEKHPGSNIIKVGNLDAERDFTDVRDMVEAYWLALEKGEPGDVYNICMGKCYPMRNILNKLISMSKVSIKIVQDPERMRPSDLEVLLGDNKKFKEQTGWEPKYDISTTLQDILDYWRERL